MRSSVLRLGPDLILILAGLLLGCVERIQSDCFEEAHDVSCVMSVTCVDDVPGDPIRRSTCHKRYFYVTYEYKYNISWTSSRSNFTNPAFDAAFKDYVIKILDHITNLTLSRINLFSNPLSRLSLPKVATLDLSYNYLDIFDISSLNYYDELTMLDLSNNNIVNIVISSADADRNIPLKTLNLSRNQIQYLGDDTFKRLNSLTRLDLSRNLLTEINISTFNGLHQLTWLNISFNSLNELNMALYEINKLELLDISHNHLTTLNKNDFKQFSDLRLLYLQNNSLTELDKNIFSSLTLLEEINLSRNNFTAGFQVSQFENNLNLRSIDISFAGITTLVKKLFAHQTLETFVFTGNSLCGALEPGHFVGLSRLTELDISEQNVTSISNHAFQGLDNLNELNLSHNAIQLLEIKSFAHLTKVVSIDLSFNRIHVFNIDNADLIALNVLNLNNNLITAIDRNPFQNLTDLDISFNQIQCLYTDGLPIPTLQHIRFGHNNISKIEPEAFAGLSQMWELDLSGAKLSKLLNNTFIGLENLRLLNLSNNRIQFVDSSAFKGTSNLTALDLSNNELRGLIINGVEVPNLSELKLNNNNISELFLLNDFEKLETLDLSKNELNTSTLHFGSFRALRQLKLAHTGIDGKFDVPNCRPLTRLDISENSVESLHYNSETTNLNELILSSNHISDMSALNLKRNTFLEVINLSKNIIEQIDVTSFSGVEALTIIDISYNSLTTLRPGSFVHLRSLQLLNISHNNIFEIKYGLFTGLNRVQVIDLSHNSIAKLHMDTFYPLTHLREIILDKNRIIKIDDLAYHFKHGIVLSMGGNPLSCTWLGSILKYSTEFKITTLKPNFTAENLAGITCVRDSQTNSDYLIPYGNATLKNSVLQYDVRPYLSNISHILVDILNKNTSMSTVSGAHQEKLLLANMTGLLQKNNVQGEIQNNNIKQILDQLRQSSNVTSSVLPKMNTKNFSDPVGPILITQNQNDELLVKLSGMIDQRFGELKTYLNLRALQNPKPEFNRFSITRDRLIDDAKLKGSENYSAHIKLTEACVVIILIVMLSVIVYKLYLWRVLRVRNDADIQSIRHIEMEC